MEKWEIYVGEAQTQIKFALRAYTHFDEARQNGDSEAVFYHLHHFIVHTVNVDKLVSPKPGSEREVILRGRIDIGGTDLKQIRRMRNHLEHYDERLDHWIANFYGGPFFDMNITTGSTGFPYHAALRALDGNNLCFAGETYDVAALHAQLLELNQLILLV
jgi:hypothetical protein